MHGGFRYGGWAFVSGLCPLPVVLFWFLLCFNALTFPAFGAVFFVALFPLKKDCTQELLA